MSDLIVVDTDVDLCVYYKREYQVIPTLATKGLMTAPLVLRSKLKQNG